MMVQRGCRHTGSDLDRLYARLTLAGDTRDILAARDSVRQLLGIGPPDP